MPKKCKSILLYEAPGTQVVNIFLPPKRRLSCESMDLPNSSLYIMSSWPSVGAACREDTRPAGVDCTGHLFCFLGAKPCPI
ncbi:hypothetical protein EVAR_3309_1 [Eumeta japonica]|uniref:Uncharacterized protein n=1 Tax=Eumeta variegata TaxID=151549 RepID=A0A4C1SV74_EUMVA|nr:hypothetical protein EVAR_3309_1 [Eumeta japonica]